MPRLTGHLCEITVDLPPLGQRPTHSQRARSKEHKDNHILCSLDLKLLSHNWCYYLYTFKRLSGLQYVEFSYNNINKMSKSCRSIHEIPVSSMWYVVSCLHHASADARKYLHGNALMLPQSPSYFSFVKDKWFVV